MKLRPLKELIGMSKEKLDIALAPIRARQIKSQAELEMAKLDAEILTLESSIQEMCTGKEIAFSALLDNLDKVALLERRKKQYSKVLDELFPE